MSSIHAPQEIKSQTPSLGGWTGKLPSITSVPMTIGWSTSAAREWSELLSGDFVGPDFVVGSMVVEVKVTDNVSLSSTPRSSCEPIATWKANSLHDLVSDEGFQRLVRECFGGPARVKRSTPNPEELAEPEIELLMLTTTLPAVEANDRLIELFGEIEEHGSQVLRDAVIGLENPA